jgi:hypothetical protein
MMTDLVARASHSACWEAVITLKAWHNGLSQFNSEQIYLISNLSHYN